VAKLPSDSESDDYNQFLDGSPDD